jgi:hypothetical protein
MWISSAIDLNIGSKSQEALELSHGASKGPMDLVRS